MRLLMSGRVTVLLREEFHSCPWKVVLRAGGTLGKGWVLQGGSFQGLRHFPVPRTTPLSWDGWGEQGCLSPALGKAEGPDFGSFHHHEIQFAQRAEGRVTRPSSTGELPGGPSASKWHSFPATGGRSRGKLEVLGRGPDLHTWDATIFFGAWIFMEGPHLCTLP